MLFALFACTGAPDLKNQVPPVDSGTLDTADTADTADSGASTDTGFAAGDLHLGLPSYANPLDPAWPQFVDAAAQTRGFVILNPNSGPGGHLDEDWAAAAEAARAAGVIVLGYVATGYGARAGGEIDSEVVKYAEWYAVDGIFYDEVAEDCPAYAAQYAERAAFADAHVADNDAFIVYNPGLLTCADYLDTADVLVVAETRGKDLESFVAADWMAPYDPSRFWFLAYEVRAATLGDMLDVVRNAGVGWVYLTDDNLPNPWDQTASYLSDEVAAAVADD